MVWWSKAAALGLMSRVGGYFASATTPTPSEVTNAFWSACHGAQRLPADYLLGLGADLNLVGYEGLTPIDEALGTGLVNRRGAFKSFGDPKKLGHPSGNTDFRPYIHSPWSRADADRLFRP
jgi:hypothetical protein